jgi:hypothetical protein
MRDTLAVVIVEKMPSNGVFRSACRHKQSTKAFENRRPSIRCEEMCFSQCVHHLEGDMEAVFVLFTSWYGKAFNNGRVAEHRMPTGARGILHWVLGEWRNFKTK